MKCGLKVMNRDSFRNIGRSRNARYLTPLLRLNHGGKAEKSSLKP